MKPATKKDKPQVYSIQVGPQTKILLAELHTTILKRMPRGVTILMSNVLQHALLAGLIAAKTEFNLKSEIPSSILE